MKRILIQLFKWLVVFLALVLLINELCYTETPDIKKITKAVSVIFAYICWIFGVRRRRGILDKKIYAKAYKEIIRTAFQEDRGNYNKLMKAIGYINSNKCGKAIKCLEQLKSQCASFHDTSAVLALSGYAYTKIKQYDKVIEVNRELLRSDYGNSLAWTCIGFAYLETGRGELADESFENAMSYDDRNHFTYTNLASYFLIKGQPEKTVEYAQKALAINKDLSEPYGFAAIGYFLLKDVEQAKKCLKQYEAKGGNGKSMKKLRKLLRKM